MGAYENTRAALFADAASRDRVSILPRLPLLRGGVNRVLGDGCVVGGWGVRCRCVLEGCLGLGGTRGLSIEFFLAKSIKSRVLIEKKTSEYTASRPSGIGRETDFIY